MQPLSVSTLTNQIKSLLETSFSRIRVEGELSRITYHNSGHIYFTLKDENATIRAVMFRGNATKLRFLLEEGLKVVIDAALTLYTPRGEYQLNCFNIEPSGHGALAYAFEQLKNKLAQKGYFEHARKKALPKFPKKIALITSATGAALQDMLRIAQHRYPLCEIDIYDVLVQGENAAKSIASALTYTDSLQIYDAIVIGRGGGSIEDLWAFNEEILADAIYHTQAPVISAVGHEIDTVISDFVADVRAATPSNAMELLLPDKTELLIYIDSLMEQLQRRITHIISLKHQELTHLKDAFERHSFERKITQQEESITQLRQRFEQTIAYTWSRFTESLHYMQNELPKNAQNVIERKNAQLSSLFSAFEASNPKLKSKKGFAQIVHKGKIVNPASLEPDQEFEAQTSDIIVTAKVLNKRNIL